MTHSYQPEEDHIMYTLLDIWQYYTETNTGNCILDQEYKLNQVALSLLEIHFVRASVHLHKLYKAIFIRLTLVWFAHT